MGSEMCIRDSYHTGPGGSALLGLKYEGIIPVLRLLYSKKKSKRLFEEIQLIEQGMVKAKDEQN